MERATHLSLQELEAGLEHILLSPKESGTVELIVRRPRVDERETLAEAALDQTDGLLGDTWKVRPSKNMPDHSANPNAQLTLMNARVIALVAQTKDRWPLAGDQLYVDLDLSAANLPAGTRLQVGTAVVEVTAQPHTGCDKFTERFGRDAVVFVNGPAHRDLRMRGINTKIIQPGTVKVGDVVRKIK
jgi:hypothetical protein